MYFALSNRSLSPWYQARKQLCCRWPDSAEKHGSDREHREHVRLRWGDTYRQRYLCIGSCACCLGDWSCLLWCLSPQYSPAPPVKKFRCSILTPILSNKVPSKYNVEDKLVYAPPIFFLHVITISWLKENAVK